MTAAILLALVVQLPVSTRAISGVVMDPSGAPVAGATVRSAAGNPAGSEAITGANGTFVLSAVADAPVTVVVSADGFADQTVWVARDVAGPLRVHLSPRGIAESITVSANPDRLRVMTPVSATVLDSDSLASASALTIDDQLRSIPGFSLFRRSSSRVANPTTQGATLRGLAASGASRTAVLADGVPLNDPFGGWVYWDRLPAAAIERIEVARGGSSDLHGSDALGGAIRISTSVAPGARVWVDAGSHSTARLSAYGGREFSEWSASGALETSVTDGFVVVAPESRGPIDVPAYSEYTSAHGRIGVPLIPATRLDVRGSYFTEDRGNGTPFQTNATIVRQVTGSAAGDVWGGAWAIRATGASQGYDQTFSAVAADRSSERPTSLQHVDAGSAGVEVEWVRGGERQASLVSFAFRDVDADLYSGPAPDGPLTLTAAEQRTGAATFQASFQPGEAVTLGVGVRGEVWLSALRDGGPSRTRSHWVPRASIAWRVSPGVSLRTAVHQAYRTPTINELHRPFRVGNVVTNANDTLDPESSFGVESALFARRGRAAMRVAAFWTRLSDAVVNVTLESGPAGIVRERQNAGRIRAAGVEVEADARLLDVVSISAAAAYIDSVFTEGAGLDGLRVPQVPHWQLSAGVLAAWPRASLSVDWRFIGGQFDDDRNEFLLEASGMLNVRAGWRVGRRLELFAAVENALDQEQDVGRTPVRTIGLPRTARIGVRWER